MKKILPVLATICLLFTAIGMMQQAHAVMPPVAVLAGPYWAGIGDSILFDGSGSYDPEGLSMTYEWDWGDGSPPATGTDLKYPTHTYGANGVYTVTLTVTDDGGLTDSDTARVDITPPYARVVAHKWSDDNGNGVQDAGELDIQGWLFEVYVSEDFGVTWTHATNGHTGPDGSVTFDILDTGLDMARIVEEQRPGWINTTRRSEEVLIGAYITMAVYFGNMQVPQQVIPEVPLGSIVASAAMIIALIGYFTIPKLRIKQTDVKA